MICCTSTAERSSRVQVQQHSLVEKMENAALGTYSKLKNELNTKNWKEKKMKETLKYHSTTQSQLSFRDIRSVRFESIKHCEGISPASVQMKLTASAPEEQQ